MRVRARGTRAIGVEAVLYRLPGSSRGRLGERRIAVARTRRAVAFATRSTVRLLPVARARIVAGRYLLVVTGVDPSGKASARASQHLTVR